LGDAETVAKLAISVIIPVHNGGANFRRCLLNVTQATPPPGEVIVVADGDSDGSWRLAEEIRARVLRIPVPGGPARARNLGAREARGDILLFVDADVALCRDAIHQIVGAFRHDPGLAAVFGSYDDCPAATNFLSQYKNLLHHYVHQTGREEASTFWAACGAIRREVFLSLGGFDERYRHPSIEDIELGYRLKRAEHRIRLCKTLQVTHLKRWGIVSLLRSDFFHRALPWTELILRDRRLINDLNLQYSSRMSVLLIYGILGSLVGAWWRPGLFTVAGVLVLTLLVLNAALYRFFQHKRGVWFTLRSIAWHWLYYCYSGLAFGFGVARYVFHGPRSPWPGFRKAGGEWSETEGRQELR
jgi:glycosyltransferase involved in cell wall biosynthesis